MAYYKEGVIQRYVGASTDTKPTLTTKDAGSKFYETDTKLLYAWSGSAWTIYELLRTNKDVNIQIEDVNVSSSAPVPFSTGGASVSAAQTRPDNNTAYGIADVVGTDPATNLEFAAVAPVSGGHLLLTGVDVRIDAAAIPAGMTTFELHLFNAAPTAIADNTAWALADADRAKYLGKVMLSAPVDVGGTLWSQTDGINKKFKCAAASTTIYGQLATSTAYTPTALTVKTVTLHTVGV